RAYPPCPIGARDEKSRPGAKSTLQSDGELVKKNYGPIAGKALRMIHLRYPRPGGCMEDYEEQEVEFWRKLAEEDISRGTMLRRSAAAAFGLTVLGGSSSALAATRMRSAA